MRKTATGLLAACALLALPACGEREELNDEIKAAIQKTRESAYTFVYSDERPDDFITGKKGIDVSVKGIVEDDFRFKARAAINGVDAFDEVVSDDILAVRFVDPSRIGNYVDKARAAEAENTTDIEGVSVVEALQSRRWVLDPSSAPYLTAGSPQIRDLGKDPVYDALTVLDYVDEAVDNAEGIERWSADDITPTYSSSEDVFPEPEDGSGVERYDLRRPRLPVAANRAGGTGGQGDIIETRHFRKMAIYVQDDRVIRVVERVEITGKFVDDFTRYFRTVMEEAEVPQEFRDGFEEGLKEIPREQLGDFFISILNVGLATQGIDPVAARVMDFDLRDFDTGVTVDLPTTDVVRGSLDGLVFSGGSLAEAQQQGEGREIGSGEAVVTTTVPDGGSPDGGGAPDGGSPDGGSPDGDGTTDTAPPGTADPSP